MRLVALGRGDGRLPEAAAAGSQVGAGEGEGQSGGGGGGRSRGSEAGGQELWGSCPELSCEAGSFQPMRTRV